VDAARALREAAEGCEEDPVALEFALSRRGLLGDLTRKYGESVPAMLSYLASIEARLSELEGHDARARELSGLEEEARAQVESAAGVLSRARRRAGERLERDVAARFSDLALPGAQLLVEINPAQLGPSGTDGVVFLFSANRGTEAQPLQRVASGGELSRVMLALELSLREPDVPSLVFDEVDAGVGGAAGAAVGALLAELAEKAQVFCVTHLPQVASHARSHVLVRKDHGSANAEVLDGEARLRELSRMLAGQEGSRSARAHAQELLAQARAHKEVS
jgi:DNA repair protein RecN (Recombination protein N)